MRTSPGISWGVATAAISSPTSPAEESALEESTNTETHHWRSIAHSKLRSLTPMSIRWGHRSCRQHRRRRAPLSSSGSLTGTSSSSIPEPTLERSDLTARSRFVASLEFVPLMGHGTSAGVDLGLLWGRQTKDRCPCSRWITGR